MLGRKASNSMLKPSEAMSAHGSKRLSYLKLYVYLVRIDKMFITTFQINIITIYKSLKLEVSYTNLFLCFAV